MRITFCLPHHGRVPVGGFKVVYEYANGLSARGHDVHVMHPAIWQLDTPPLVKSARLGRYVQRKLTGDWHPRRWFNLADSVRVSWVPSLNERYVPDADIVVATGWHTAEWVVNYPASKGRPYHLIQHHETWTGPEARVEATWRLPLRKIVISRWLEECARQRGQAATYIPNGLDFLAFGIDLAPVERNPGTVMAMFHRAEWKGSADAIQAIKVVKQEIPELRVNMFGVFPKPRLPDWINYFRQPSPATLRRLYNEAAVFIAPSHVEGWGLPPAEAMSCGAALIATDVGGHREFAHHEHTAILVPPHNPDRLAAEITSLVRNPQRRIALAVAGHSYIQRFTWDAAVLAFETALAPSA